MLFLDEFSGRTLNRSRWNVIVTGETVNDEQQAYVDSAETLTLVGGDTAQGAVDGALEIRSHYRPGFKTPQGKTFDFISGRIDTRGKFDFKYGTAEARVKLTAGAGLWPAFWTLGNGAWPDTGEIDILENVGDPAWINFALHGPGYSGASRPGRATLLSTGIRHHRLARLLHGVDARIADVQRRWPAKRIASRARWSNSTVDGPTTRQSISSSTRPSAAPTRRPINGAKEPYPGLPQSTVDLIKADKAVMLVDWVRVTGRQSHDQTR